MNPRSILKELVFGVAHAAGLTRLARRSRRGGLTILTYHSFGQPEEHPYLHRMPVARLKAQLEHLSCHYEVVDLATGLERLQNPTSMSLKRPMASITVDDGYGDNFEYLFPLVHAARLPVMIFLATDYLDSGRLPWPTRLSAMLHFGTKPAISHPLSLPLTTRQQRIAAGVGLRQHFSRLDAADRDLALTALEMSLAPSPYLPAPPLTWNQVRTMQAAGVRFGGHTQHHGWLDRLDAWEVEAEIVHSKKRIENETDVVCDVLAYPNGSWTKYVATAAARAGYAFALTQDAGVNRRDGLKPHALKRIDVPHNERLGTFASRIAGVTL